jgi:hypothetical protein
VGCVVERTVGVVGAEGAVLIVTVEAALAVQVLSAVLLTLKVFTPELNKLNVGDA